MHYIAFLRGINVGGHRVKMEYLRELFCTMGFDDVRSYIQSGNVFFTCNTTPTGTLESRIATHLEEQLGYAVPCFVRRVSEVEAALERDSFKGVVVNANTRLCLIFVSKPLPKSVSLPHQMSGGGTDMTIIDATQSELFVVMTQSAGRPGNPVPLLEKEFGVKATVRFYHTVQKILAAASA